jgi:hypothetical protein
MTQSTALLVDATRDLAPDCGSITFARRLSIKGNYASSMGWGCVVRRRSALRSPWRLPQPRAAPAGATY